MIEEEENPSFQVFDILRYKRETTRFEILVEIAEHQPSIRQLEIAEKQYMINLMVIIHLNIL